MTKNMPNPLCLFFSPNYAYQLLSLFTYSYSEMLETFILFNATCTQIAMTMAMLPRLQNSLYKAPTKINLT